MFRAAIHAVIVLSALGRTKGFATESGWVKTLYSFENEEVPYRKDYGPEKLKQRMPVHLYSFSSLQAVQQDEAHPMVATSRLSHVMLKVPSVDNTVNYWKDKGGLLLRSRDKPKEAEEDDSNQLLSAFVTLGSSSQAGDDGTIQQCAFQKNQCFALEIVATDKEPFHLGNAISYVGVSMLLQFQKNLLGAVTGEKPQDQGDEPNGIDVRSSASAPGDFLSRFALRTKDLQSTAKFYSEVLGMESKAQDERMVCLRYKQESFPGVPVTLVFDALSNSEELDMGACFDHLAIETSADIEEQHGRFQSMGCPIYMKPTEMFGKQILGVIDPNGYKVVIFSES